MPEYTVRQGDCTSSLAHRFGLFWETIWNHPQNSQLKEIRKDANIIFPGDKIFIPEKEEKQADGATEQTHRFRRKGVPAKIRLRFLDNDTPVAGEPFVLDIDGKITEGRTDGGGWLEGAIPPDAQTGTVYLGPKRRTYKLKLGHMDPYDQISGVQARLRNLGYYTGDLTGNLDENTREALKAFQQKNNLEETGQLDQTTQDELKRKHGG